MNMRPGFRNWYIRRLVHLTFSSVFVRHGCNALCSTVVIEDDEVR